MTSQAEAMVDDGEELIAEVRAARHRISERFGHDPYRLVAHYMERQRARPEGIISAPDPGAGPTEAES